MLWFKKNSVRVRIAPSPTGLFHIGTARTALMNWLFARGKGGAFIVRIEDTDVVRSAKEHERDILDGLRWLGLDWDEGPDPKTDYVSYKGAYGPYRQSERGQIYERYAEKLLAKGDAYYCFCTEVELERERKVSEESKQAYRYSGRCRSISKSETLRRRAAGESCVIRFKIPEEKIRFADGVRGDIEFDAALNGDIVIAKSPKEPLYNFSVVIDDYEMKISDVIRGEDHIANTPKQIALARALSITPPRYAHLPLILNPDRSKMSKRYNATSVAEYKKKGYLPEAMVNFLALLGWHPKGDKERFTSAELSKEFSLSRVQKSGAIFNVEKLDWLNAEYIRDLPAERLAELLDLTPDRKTLAVLALLGGRMKRLTDFADQSRLFMKLPEYETVLLKWKEDSLKDAAENLMAVRDILRTLSEKKFESREIEGALSKLVGQKGKGNILWPLRIALSGQKNSPGPYEIMGVVGKNETLARLEHAIQKLEKSQ